ncbi:MAG TPA: hypothetical protein VFP58_09050 [Candidatus Eisenbacteria bacterium]|nr:hypothetical protein [Candidatus Eisenbacteria bacterium]
MNDRARIGRRRFVRLAAAAAAAAAMGPMASAPAPAAEKAPAKKRVRSRTAADASVRSEIENQKKQLAAILDVVRSYQLPAGSPPALVFRPLPPRRRA